MGRIRWTDEQLKTAGISKRKLAKLLRRFDECVQLMSEMKLTVYGESRTGYLIHESRPEHKGDMVADFGAIVAEVGDGFDGGAW